MKEELRLLKEKDTLKEYSAKDMEQDVSIARDAAFRIAREMGWIGELRIPGGNSTTDFHLSRADLLRAASAVAADFPGKYPAIEALKEELS